MVEEIERRKCGCVTLNCSFHHTLNEYNKNKVIIPTIYNHNYLFLWHRHIFEFTSQNERYFFNNNYLCHVKLIVKPFNCYIEEGRTPFISMQGLVSPERTTEHRQVVKRSGTPAMWCKVKQSAKGTTDKLEKISITPLRFHYCLCSFMPQAFLADTNRKRYFFLRISALSA